MKHKRKRPRPGRVREPVQVYLDPDDRARLERLTERLETSKSEALRRGLEALERQLTDPAEHPALRIVGIAGREGAAAQETDPDRPQDAAREHDRVLTDAEESTWQGDAG